MSTMLFICQDRVSFLGRLKGRARLSMTLRESCFTGEALYGAVQETKELSHHQLETASAGCWKPNALGQRKPGWIAQAARRFPVPTASSRVTTLPSRSPESSRYPALGLLIWSHVIHGFPRPQCTRRASARVRGGASGRGFRAGLWPQRRKR